MSQFFPLVLPNPFQFVAQCRNFSAKFQPDAGALSFSTQFFFRIHLPVLVFNFIGICRHADIFTYVPLFVTKCEKGNECESKRGRGRKQTQKMKRMRFAAELLFFVNIFKCMFARTHSRTYVDHTVLGFSSARRVLIALF